MFTIKIKNIVSNKISVLSFIISFIAMGSFFLYFSDFELIEGNYWKNYLYLDYFLNFLISFLFAFFLASNIYKSVNFWEFNKKSWLFWFIWTFFWVLITGCPTCSLTLAYYLWLASVFSASVSVFWNEINLFPFWGIEIKVLWVVFLIYSIYINLKNLDSCKLKTKK